MKHIEHFLSEGDCFCGWLEYAQCWRIWISPTLGTFETGCGKERVLRIKKSGLEGEHCLFVCLSVSFSLSLSLYIYIYIYIHPYLSATISFTFSLSSMMFLKFQTHRVFDTPLVSKTGMKFSVITGTSHFWGRSYLSAGDTVRVF